MGKTRMTIDDVLALKPCSIYTRERLQELFGRRKYATPEVVATCKEVPLADRKWLLIRMMPSDRERRLFACDCAERALKRERKAGREPDTRSWEAVRVARRYANGKATIEELAAAWAAARAARTAARVARAAAWAAARAAWVAARDSAWAAAWDAWDAAWDSAWAAAWAAGVAGVAAGDAEQRWQLKRAVRYCEGM